MSVFAQVPLPVGSDVVIEEAAKRGWEAVALAVMMLAIIFFFVWVMKKVLEDAKSREERLAARVTHLEDVIRTELFDVLRRNGEVMALMTESSTSISRVCDRIMGTLDRFTMVLENRPCMAMDAAERLKLVEALATHCTNQEKAKHSTA